MTSKTKIQILNDCFNELRINGITAQADNEDVVLALGRLEDLMAEQPFDIGFKFEDVPNPNSYSGIPPNANFAIASALALRMAPIYGKAPETLMRQSSAAMSALANKVATPRRVGYPSRQPLGMGNRRVYRNNYQFMPEQSRAPTSVNTETMNVGDKLVGLSIDFSQYLQPLETVSSYTKLVSGGLAVTAESTSLAAISFSVQANSSGFQQILFSVIGSAGTELNRTLNFNVVDSTAARGNP
jgi:hypothetical protein